MLENLIGGALADTLNGNSLANRITGGKANDRLTGDAGSDRIRFATAPNATTNRYVITDFSITHGDTIELENPVFTALHTTGTLVASAFFFGADATTSSHRILYNASTGLLAYESDGNGIGAAIAFGLPGALQQLLHCHLKHSDRATSTQSRVEAPITLHWSPVSMATGDQ
jgi:Ca2+-binding RTX toxin-like protein